MMQSVDTKEKGPQGYCGYSDTQHICLSDLLYYVWSRSQGSFKMNLIAQRIHEHVLTVNT